MLYSFGVGLTVIVFMIGVFIMVSIIIFGICWWISDVVDVMWSRRSDRMSGVKGYRDLSQSEVDVINNVKTTGEALEATVAALEALDSEIDQRWVAIGRTHLQQGIMALVRAVARPTTF